MGPAERRKFPRINIACNVTVIFGERLLLFNAHADNLGNGGLRVILEERLHIGTLVELELFLAGNQKPLKCKGEVSWIKEKSSAGHKSFFNTGIKFVELNDSVREEIKKLIGG